jgi:cytochrome b involved in lipid metabolism
MSETESSPESNGSVPASGSAAPTATTTTTTAMLPPPDRPVPATNEASSMPPPNRPASVPADRHMNDSTMPPPRFTNVKVSTTKKPAVNPKHRFGLHDWKRLLAASSDLAQRKGQPIRRDITAEEVRQHSKNHDGWIILRGRVYNIGPYLSYHPGGVSIFKNLLGKDATSMFDRYHRWVNIDGLIGPLLLGFIDTPPKVGASPFSVVPPKEAQLTNAPRVSAQAASGSSLLTGKGDDEEEEEEQILPPPPITQS